MHCPAFLCNPNYCSGKEAAMVIIVVSLSCTAYQYGTLIMEQIGPCYPVANPANINILQQQ